MILDLCEVFLTEGVQIEESGLHQGGILKVLVLVINMRNFEFGQIQTGDERFLVHNAFNFEFFFRSVSLPGSQDFKLRVFGDLLTSSDFECAFDGAVDHLVEFVFGRIQILQNEQVALFVGSSEWSISPFEFSKLLTTYVVSDQGLQI